MEGLLILLGSMAFVLLVISIGTLIQGYVVLKFWYWFILPVFTNALHITLIQAVGLSLVINLFHSSKLMKLKLNDTEIKQTPDFAALLIPVLTLLIGWLVHLIL